LQKEGYERKKKRNAFSKSFKKSSIIFRTGLKEDDWVTVELIREGLCASTDVSKVLMGTIKSRSNEIISSER
jgi:hypothetical protein